MVEDNAPLPAPVAEALTGVVAACPASDGFVYVFTSAGEIWRMMTHPFTLELVISSATSFRDGPRIFASRQDRDAREALVPSEMPPRRSARVFQDL